MGLQIPPVVACDSKQGTIQLAKHAVKQVANGSDLVNVVLIHGADQRKDSRARILGFLKGLRESEVPFKRVGTLTCDWQRKRATDAFVEFVHRTPSPIHIVFAANDDMALGVEDAILRGLPDHQQRVKDCVIYGFDAIPEMLDHIKHKGGHAKGTVGQPLQEMARGLVDLLQRFRKNPALTSEEGESLDVLVDPRPSDIYLAPTPEARSPSNAPPPKYTNSDKWARSKDAPKSFCKTTQTLLTYERKLISAAKDKSNWKASRDFEIGKDEHGLYGIYGRKKTRKCRIWNGKVFWWIGDPV